MDRQSPDDFLARHGEFVEPAKLEALTREAEKFAREKANGGSHPTGSQPDDFPKKAESAPRGSPDTMEAPRCKLCGNLHWGMCETFKSDISTPEPDNTSETRPARGGFEHFDHFEQPPETAHNNQWPKPDLRIVEDGRAPSPTLDDDVDLR